MGRVFANGQGVRDSIPGRVIRKTQNMVLDVTIIRYGSRVKEVKELRPPRHLGGIANEKGAFG